MSQPWQGYKSTLDHDSFFGWINLFKRRDQKFMFPTSYRPPYPIIIDQPTLGQTVRNMNRADLGLFLTSAFVGFFLARYGVRKWQGSEYQWPLVYYLDFKTHIKGSKYEILYPHYTKGFTDNGLQWRRKDDSLHKYDFTSEMESQSIWRYFRIRDK